MFYPKEILREMLPVIIRDEDYVSIKSFLHYIFGLLYNAGFRVFHFYHRP